MSRSLYPQPCVDSLSAGIGALLLECDVLIAHKGLGHGLFAFNRKTRVTANKYSRTADKGIIHQHGIKTSKGNILKNVFVTALIKDVQGAFSSGPHDQLSTYMWGVQ